MKLKDHYQKLKTQAKIDKNEDLDKFIENAPDIDIPDPVIAVIEENFLTRERAKTDKEIHSKIKSEVYDAVDATISSMYTLIPVEDAQKIGAETNTHNKIAMLKKSFEGSIEKAKAANPDRDKKLEEAEKQIRLDAERVQALQAEHEKKIKEATDNHAAELKKIKIESIVTAKIGQLELAKEFSEDPEVKQDTISNIRSKILKENIEFDENGQPQVRVIENGVAKPKFVEGTNTIVTFDHLLETASAKYIKRNNGKGDEGGKETRKVVHSAVPDSQKTLQQIRAEKALSA